MSVTMSTWNFASRVHEQHTAAPVSISATHWLDPRVRLLEFDRLLHAAEDRDELGFAILLLGDEPDCAVAEAQLRRRYQRLFARRNLASDSARFDALLALHASLHDRGKPLVRADHDHALDVWQWTLRLSEQATEALQIAALFHDVERLASEADVRVEQHAVDYLAFKQRHAAQGARMMRALLAKLDVEQSTAERAAFLIERHEQPASDDELNVLNDADALSFFALNSPGYLAYFGLEQTRKKVRYTLGRMRSPAAFTALRTVRLEPEIEQLIAEAAVSLGQPT